MTDIVATGDVKPEFRVGRVLSQIFGTFFGNFFKFFIIGVLGYALMYGILALVTGGMMLPGAQNDPSQMVQSPGLLILNYGVGMVGAAIIQAAVTYGAVEYQAGRKPSISGMIGIGFNKIIPVVIATLLTTVLWVIGFMLLFIPGVIVGIMLSVTIPAIVAEGKGPLDAMRRSRELTSGFKWQIFAVLLVLVILAWVLMAVVLGSLLSMIMAGTLSGGAGVMPVLVAVSVASIAGGLSYGFIGSVVSTIYTNLRAAKEGASVDDIAAVFQ